MFKMMQIGLQWYKSTYSSTLCKYDCTYLTIYIHFIVRVMMTFLWKYEENMANLMRMQLAENCMRMQFHMHAILDFRNAVLRDEDPELNKSIVFCTIKIRLDFPFYFPEFPLYLQHRA